MTEGSAPQSGTGLAPLAALERALASLRRAMRAQLVVARSSLIVACLVGIALGAGLLDYLVRFPQWMRIILWLAGAGALVMALAKALGPVLRLRPSDTELALRLERSDVGRRKGWEGLLASGLELSRLGAADEVTDRRLATIARDLAAQRFGPGASALHLLDPRRLRQGLGLLAAALACVGGLSLVRPDLLRVGAQRVLAPWSGAQWPKRTGVLHAAMPTAQAIGSAVPLRAVVTRSARPLEQTRVWAELRVLIDGREASSQRVMLSPQGTRANAAQSDPSMPSPEGDLFERLIDSQSLLPASREAWAGKDVELEYTFQTSDDRTSPWRVRLVEPPEVRAVRVSVSPPSYVQTLPGVGDGLVRGEVDLRGAAVERGAAAVVGPVLVGSRVRVVVELSRPLEVPEEGRRAVWLSTSLPGLLDGQAIDQSDLMATLSADRWEFSFAPRASVRTPIRPVDQFGIGPREEPSLRIDVVEDRPPTALVAEPAQDEMVLPQAIVPAQGEGRDDVGLASVTLRTQVARADASSPGAIASPQGEPVEAAVTSWTPTSALPVPEGQAATSGAAPTARLLRAGTTLELSTFNLAPGDELWLTSVAVDVRTALADDQVQPQSDAPAPEPVVSGVRRLKIISESQLVEQVRSELGGLRDGAQRLEREQLGLVQDSPRAGEDVDAARQQAQRQARVGEQVAPIGEVAQRLRQRLERNALEDPALRGLLDDVRQASDEAREASAQARQALQRAAQQQDMQARQRDATQAQQAQEQAAQRLGELVEMLNQGNDDWTVRRSFEQLLNQQRQVRAQTQALQGQTQGQEMAELSPAQRQDMERLARRQQELAQQAAQALEQAQERAQQLRETSPAQAQAMQQAVDRARARQLQQQQQQASQQIAQNQTGQAQESQQQAEQALEEALEAMDEAQQARDEQLQRTLADVVQSLQELVVRQRQEIERLAPALAGQDVQGLDAGMLQLQRNTLGVADKVRAEVEDATRLLGLLDAADQAQAAAIVALREQPADYAGADQSERVSLSRLQEATDAARQLQRDAQRREEDRTRRELRKAYTEALEQQTALREKTGPLVDVEATRRSRNTARGLAQEQQAIRTRLEELRSRTQDLAEAKVFDFAHTRLDESMARAAQSLGEGVVTRGTARQQASAIATLASLIEALKDRDRNDGLQDGGGGGGGGGGGQGQQQGAIPPIAELILLRGMQAEVAQRTRELDQVGGAGPDASSLDAAELADLTRLQRDLTTQSQQLLERMQQEQGGGAAPITPPDVAPAPPEQDPAPPQETPE